VEKLIPFLKEDFDAIVVHYKNRFMCRDKNFVYKDKNLFLEELGWYIGMMATVLYRDSFLKSANFEKYFDTDFGQALTLLDYFAKKKNLKVQYISDDIVWNTPQAIKGSQNWYNRAIEIFTKQWYEGIKSLPNEYDEISKLRCIKNHSTYTVGFYSNKSLLFYRFCGALDLMKVVKFAKYIYIVAGFKVLVSSFFISFVPKKAIPIYFKETSAYIKRVFGEEYLK